VYYWWRRIKKRDLHRLFSAVGLRASQRAQPRPGPNYCCALALLASLLGSFFSRPALALEDPFADPRLAACIRDTLAKNQWQNYEQITHLECHSQQIESLSGIEKLTGLQKLSLYNNQIADLVLADFTALRHVNLAKNNLSHVDLRALPNLTELFLFNNRLKQLQLPDLPHLTLLKVGDNQIKQFNYTNLPRLQKLYAFNNAMETFDIERLPALLYMDTRQNPMPDSLYEKMDAMKGVTFLHDGNAEDWE
jgi:protein phosphatase 1 regulatory subunit 7